MAQANTAAVCVANIGPRGRRQRMLVGVVGLVVCTAATGGLIVADASRLWRLALFVPWCICALGIFQAREQTCVALVAQGLRDLDGRPEPIPAHEVDAVRRQARRVYAQSVILALVLTAMSLIPG
jgi:hypothetical protein